MKSLGYPLLVFSALLLRTLGASASEPSPSLSHDIQPIFDSYCLQCHMLNGAQAGLVLEEGESYAHLVGIQSTESKLLRVKAGAPKDSYLFQKLQGTHTSVGGIGSGMPMVDGVYKALDKEKIALIRRWIELGAKND